MNDAIEFQSEADRAITEHDKNAEQSAKPKMAKKKTPKPHQEILILK